MFGLFGAKFEAELFMYDPPKQKPVVFLIREKKEKKAHDKSADDIIRQRHCNHCSVLQNHRNAQEAFRGFDF